MRATRQATRQSTRVQEKAIMEASVKVVCESYRNNGKYATAVIERASNSRTEAKNPVTRRCNINNISNIYKGYNTFLTHHYQSTQLSAQPRTTTPSSSNKKAASKTKEKAAGKKAASGKTKAKATGKKTGKWNRCELYVIYISYIYVIYV